MYEISETWFFCEHRAMKAFYTLEKFGETEKMKLVEHEYVR